MRLLENRTIVVTGAASGIGRAIVLECAKEGANVVINYRRNRAGAELLAHNAQLLHGGQARVMNFDVTKSVQVNKAVAECMQEFSSLDGWVNNAAVNLPGLLLAQTDEAIQSQIEVNLLGVIHCLRAAIRPMLSQKFGSIVNIGSITRHHVSAGQTIYAATKGAVATLTQAAAKEYGRKGIRVNCIEPGPVDTPMLATSKMLKGWEIVEKTPLARLGSPEDIAALTVFLLSEKAAYITGSLYTIDGGYSLG